MPVSTVVWHDGISVHGVRYLARHPQRRWLVRLACGHEATAKVQPKIGSRRACRRCAALRTTRAYREVVRLAKLNLTEREVEYLAGRLAEQRDRRDGGK